MSNNKYVVQGEYILASSDIEYNAGKKVIKLKVTNTGRQTNPSRISLPHLLETNSAPSLTEKKAAEAHRLNVPAGLARIRAGIRSKVGRSLPGGAKSVRLYVLENKEALNSLKNNY